MSIERRIQRLEEKCVDTKEQILVIRRSVVGRSADDGKLCIIPTDCPDCPGYEEQVEMGRKAKKSLIVVRCNSGCTRDCRAKKQVKEAL